MKLLNLNRTHNISSTIAAATDKTGWCCQRKLIDEHQRRNEAGNRSGEKARAEADRAQEAEQRRKSYNPDQAGLDLAPAARPLELTAPQSNEEVAAAEKTAREARAKSDAEANAAAARIGEIANRAPGPEGSLGVEDQAESVQSESIDTEPNELG